MSTHYCTARPCPICHPALYPPHYPPNYPHYGYATPIQRGCICPPGAELTCQGFGCPRKGFSASGPTCAASAIETGTAETEGLGPKDESAPEGDAQK